MVKLLALSFQARAPGAGGKASAAGNTRSPSQARPPTCIGANIGQLFFLGGKANILARSSEISFPRCPISQFVGGIGRFFAHFWHISWRSEKSHISSNLFISAFQYRDVN
jgi:hypothetical protein